MSQPVKQPWAIIGALVVAILDRVTKTAALAWCVQPCVFNRFMAFDLALNRGISCGLFHFESTIGFVIISLLVCVILSIIIVWSKRFYRQGEPILGHLLIIAGGLSNVYDRFVYGGVVDFISVSLNGWHWALFNVADIAINVGVLLLLIQHMRTK